MRARVAAAMRIRDEKGFTTVGMAVALLLTLALVFSAAQVYRVTSASAEVQEVADAAALAAESEVADFLWAARKADAACLSMTLLAGTLYGVGVVALCVPAAQPLAAKVLDLADKVVRARNAFAGRVADGLNVLQRALPLVAAAKCAACAQANDDAGVGTASYFGFAVLVPAEGEPIEVPAAEGLEGLGQHVLDQAPAIEEAATEAEEAAEEANEAKRLGWLSDCGAAPERCMQERAARLAGLADGQNPLYSSPDAWTFSVALQRARAYYAAREASEAPAGSSVEEGARSALRKRFYAYASDELSRAYVNEDEDSFEASFPRLFRNTEQLRSTPLYEEAAYPVTGSGASQTMHAWAGCPNAAGATRRGSVAELETGSFVTCPACTFTPSSLGNVAAASTSIDNGFEHHYQAMVDAAEAYEKARARLDPLRQEVKGRAQPLFEECLEVLKALCNARIEAAPPGRRGAIAFVVNMEVAAADSGLETSFVRGGGTLGKRAAVAGATLLADARRDGSEVMGAWAEGHMQELGTFAGAAALAYQAWAFLLDAYASGQQAVISAIEGALDALPLMSASGLGGWAADALGGLMETLGLQPADLDVLKPVLLNTAHVAEGDDGSFSVRYVQAQQRARSLSSASGELFGSLIDDAEEGAYAAIDKVAGSLVIAQLDFPVGDLSVPIQVPLPSAVSEAASGLVGQAASVLRDLCGSLAPVRPWQ